MRLCLQHSLRISGDGEGTPARPSSEKEEGELDTTQSSDRHDKIDYNALDFEEDIEHDYGNTSLYLHTTASVALR